MSLYDAYRPEQDATTAAHRFVEDLDRCEHGRHRVDNCYGCEGQSRGNPRARGEDPRTKAGESVLGFDLYGRLYVLVDPGDDRFAGRPHVELRSERELA